MMTVVCGAPGAGKTTYVREQRQAGQLVVDIDMLFAALTLEPLYRKDTKVLGQVLDVADFVTETLLPAWVISTDASRSFREYMRLEYGAHVVVLETPAEECLGRIQEDDRRDDETNWPALVATWWEAYEPDERDEVVGWTQ